MNILEALRSGKRFKRQIEPTWHHVINENYPCMNIRIESILAEDWEIEQNPIIISEDDFDKAWSDSIGDNFWLKSDIIEELKFQLKKHLNFID
jgi:hypothetical protein